MAVILIASTGVRSPSSPVGGEITSPEINTIGANALFIYTNSYGIAANVLDSAGNTWGTNPPTMYSTIVPPNGADGILWYARQPVMTSAHHTFSAGGIGMTVQAAAFSGVAAYDTESAGSAVNTGTSVSTGPVTPNHAGSLVLAVTGEGWMGPLTVDSGFTILGTPLPYVAGIAYAAGWAWQVQTAAATVNPGFHFGSLAAGTNAQARAAVFSAVPTPPGSTPKLWLLRQPELHFIGVSP